jgi:ATP-dependent helicase Lhr and Lhr-like helicase
LTGYVLECEISRSTYIEDILKQIKEKKWTEEDLVNGMKEDESFTSKFSPHLPQHLQEEMHIAHEINIEELEKYFKSYTFRVIEL